VPLWRLFYHVVWTTKGREPWICEEEEKAILWSLERTFEDIEAIPHAVGVMPDHVHVAVSVPPKISPSELARRLKGGTSRAVNERVDRRGQPPFAWQGEYAVLSFGEQALPTVIAYVTNQKTHHAENTMWPGLERTEGDGGWLERRTKETPGPHAVSRLQPTSRNEPGT
jgi:putative transposase